MINEQTIVTRKYKTESAKMGRLSFLKESLKNIKDIGTITRSSRYISKNMVKLAELKGKKIIVELGSGDGVITKHILHAMSSDAVLLAFEVNPKFCQILNNIKDERLKVINISVEKMESALVKLGYSQIDAIISALPFTNFKAEMATSIIHTCHKMLRPEGKFVQIHYSLKLKVLYLSIFGNLKINFELRNIPPAFILLANKLPIL